MNELPGFLGWATAILYGAAILNFFLKKINKYYINKLPKEKVNVKKYYRILMKLLVKHHRWFGLGAGVVVVCHFILMSTTRWISGSGLVALGVLALTIITGIYGFYINKNLKGTWVKYHRVIAFIVLIFIFLHLN